MNDEPIKIKDRAFFISFTEADLEMATALNTALNENGYSTWFHPRDCLEGQNIVDWMNEGLKHSAQVLALYSPEYFEPSKTFSRGELSSAMYEALEGKDTRLVPVMLKQCTPLPLMKPLSFIDLQGLMAQDAAKELIDKLATPNRMVNRSKADATTLSRSRPKTYNILGQPIANFIGRNISMARLHHMVMAPSSQVTAITAQGMGGVGKTSLAREYFFQHGVEAHFAGVWWIEAETETSILAAFERLAKEKSVGVEPTADQTATAHAILKWLSQQKDSKPWLLIFDNAPDFETIEEWLPLSPTRAIITTRNTNMGTPDTTLELDTWSLEDTVEFLKRRIGHGTKKELESLAKRLDGLPLAAEQAGAFLQSRKTVNFASYEKNLIKHLKAFEKNLKKAPNPLLGNYPKSLYATFETALEDLKEHEFGEAALGVLNICAYLSPDGVELHFLTGAAQKLDILLESVRSVLNDEESGDEVIAALTDFSLMRLENDEEWGPTLHLHRLIGEIARARLAVEDEDTWLGTALGVVRTFMPQDTIPGEPFAWPLCAQLVPHVEALRTEDINLERHGVKLSYCLNQAAVYLDTRGDNDGAIHLLRQSVEIGEIIHRDSPSVIAIGMDNLAGRLEENISYWDEAERLYQRALDLKEAHLPADDPLLAVTLLNFGAFRNRQKRFPDAVAITKRAADIYKAAYGEMSCEYATVLRNLGSIYGEWDQDSPDPEKQQKEAEYTEQAAAITLSMRGWRHPETAVDFNNLAVTYAHREDFPRAADDMSHAVAIELSLAQDEHPITQIRMKTLLYYWEKSGDHEKAIRVRNGNPADILPYIEKIEAKHREWVAEDPDNRHFGPQSPITGARE